jgi:hypothetical protein
VNPKLEKLMKELGEAINQSLSDSEHIAQVIERIKHEGYDIFLVLEATIGFNKRDEEQESPSSELVTASSTSHNAADLKINAQDVRFLKSLRITMDDAA